MNEKGHHDFYLIDSASSLIHSVQIVNVLKI